MFRPLACFWRLARQEAVALMAITTRGKPCHPIPIFVTYLTEDSINDTARLNNDDDDDDTNTRKYGNFSLSIN